MAAVTRGLDAEAYDRQYQDKELLRRILRYFRPHRRKVIIVTLCIFLMALAGSALPLIVANSVDVMTSRADDRLVPLLIGVVFFTGIGKWVLNWVRRQLTSEVIADVILAMRQDAFASAARQDLSFYDEFSSGRIVSRITSDTQEFGEVIVLSTDVINQLAVALILIVTLFTIDLGLTLMVLVMAPFVIVAALAFRNLARKVTQQGSRAMGEGRHANQ